MPATAAGLTGGVLHYDAGKTTTFYSFRNYGQAVHFTNSDNLTIEGIQVYGCKWGTAGPGTFVVISVWDDSLKTLYQDQVPYSSISLNNLGSDQVCGAKWVEIPVPDYRVDGNFYVSVFTGSTPVAQGGPGMEIGFTVPSATGTSHTTLTDPNRIDDTTLVLPAPADTRYGQNQIDWMIRVNYALGGNATSASPGTPAGSPVSSQAPRLPLFLIAGVIVVIAVLGALAYAVTRKRKAAGPGNPPAVPVSAASQEPPSHVFHHDVFISYASEDKPIAEAVCEKLEAKNIRCWIAPRDVPPGMEFPAAIIQGIEGSRVMILIFSSHSNVSPHVLREITSAVNKGIIIVPFRIEEVQPSKSMEYLISVPHWLDAITPPFEQHIDRLATTIERIISENQQHNDGEKRGSAS
jgi:hypothetical protein